VRALTTAEQQRKRAVWPSTHARKATATLHAPGREKGTHSSQTLLRRLQRGRPRAAAAAAAAAVAVVAGRSRQRSSRSSQTWSLRVAELTGEGGRGGEGGTRLEERTTALGEGCAVVGARSSVRWVSASVHRRSKCRRAAGRGARRLSSSSSCSSPSLDPLRLALSVLAQAQR